ncbi:dephospho-CoA kinase [Oerskovia turbata]|uniref:Dephospho-CoA kinase n=1 Tax=Oerskovia turbata TaxID=1713 RepID=A0A4V1N4F5_9CELL|nr:dephospho-CoA kinase [Oerskovia turbata]RXR22055.1 dephospho-CoA kinase [Oerskovia turbata]RXR31986.1 dephospho-CoA kinase [Oerskovia turbata]TGJ96901.1 dephospho-CoA kinase [Actinotalea fermentans ATCC 43279 = JCM 9966 = DSM 3133]
MFRVGLTGGIAAGKSVALDRFAELGACVIDADVLAREAVSPGTVGLEEVVEAFGDGVLAPDGSLDRARLGTIVFGDDEARRRLNGIVHPEVRRLSAEREALVAARDPRAVVVHDIPLLVETGQAESFHLVAVVVAPEDVRLQRLVTSRGMSEDEARARIAAQATDVERVSVADVTLDGSGTPEALRAEVDALWERVVRETAEELA